MNETSIIHVAKLLNSLEQEQFTGSLSLHFKDGAMKLLERKSSLNMDDVKELANLGCDKDWPIGY